MKVDVYRKVETSEAITGKFWLDGVKECYYLEPSRYTPFYSGHPCIEAGTYHVVLTMSRISGTSAPRCSTSRAGLRFAGTSGIFRKRC